jgi:hypothetical protein
MNLPTHTQCTFIHPSTPDIGILTHSTREILSQKVSSSHFFPKISLRFSRHTKKSHDQQLFIRKKWNRNSENWTVAHSWNTHTKSHISTKESPENTFTRENKSLELDYSARVFNRKKSLCTQKKASSPCIFPFQLGWISKKFNKQHIFGSRNVVSIVKYSCGV